MGDVQQLLSKFFNSLDTGLKSLREVRSVYDEEMAFDFNPLRFFSINENTVSGMLAYFLNPKANHGQKDKLLRIFLRILNCTEGLDLLNRDVPVAVTTQYYTSGGRPIDLVIKFGEDEFIIGVENKVWGAADQREQIKDYIEDIKKSSSNRFLMLYMSRDGGGPSNESIAEIDLADCRERGKFIVVPFNKADNAAVIPIFKAFADESRADNVRAFLKLAIKYFSDEFLGVKTMDERDYAVKYLKSHPDHFAEVPLIQKAYLWIIDDISRSYYKVLRLKLGELPRKICIASGSGLDKKSVWPDEKSAIIQYENTRLPANLEFEGYDIGLPLRKESMTEDQIKYLSIYLESMRRLYPALKTNKWWEGGWITLPCINLGNEFVKEVLMERPVTYDVSRVLSQRVKK